SHETPVVRHQDDAGALNLAPDTTIGYRLAAGITARMSFKGAVKAGPEPQANRRAGIAEARCCTDRDVEDAANRQSLCGLLCFPRRKDRRTLGAAAFHPAPSSPAAARRSMDQDWPGTCLA